MRRTLGGLTAFLVLTGTFLVLPVYAAPAPAVEAVPPSIAQVELGSVEQPVDGAVVATDNEVVAVGGDADAQVGEQVPTPTDDEIADLPAAGAVATTGDEVAGVPALTVSQPETANFSAVGVTWAHDPTVTGVTVDVRVQGIDGTWGVWTTLAQDDVEQTPGQEQDGTEVRDGTAPYFTGPATGVQVVVQAADGSTPQDVSTQLIDPGTSTADDDLGAPQVVDQAHAGLDMPTIYSRAQWGADESIRTWDPEYSSTIKAATVHHTADSNDYTAGQVPSILRSIYAYHTISRGWGDIGYNVLVDRYGRAWEGRYGGLSSTVIGAHAGGFNAGTFGISMVGNFQDSPTTPIMVEQVAEVIAWKFQLYGVDPTGTTTLTSGGGGTARYAAGVRVSLPTIFGHRDVGNTTCPGAYGYAQLGNIRGRVADLMASNPRETIASRYAGDPGLRAVLGAAVGSVQTTGPLSWQVYEHGRIYDAGTGGVHEVHGMIHDAFIAAGGHQAVGVPLSDETATPDGVGRFTHFANSTSIYWTPSLGAVLVTGKVRTEWARVGWETGALGYPVSGESPHQGGTRQVFQGGTVYWSSSTGAHEVHGQIADLMSRAGGVAAVGFPVSGETATPDGVGRFTHFANSTSIYWTPSLGAVLVTGAIRAEWSRRGWEAGSLGYPVSAEAPLAGGGVQQAFQRGVVVLDPQGRVVG